MGYALEYFKDNFAMLESEYPFTSGDTGENTFNCLYSESESSHHKVRVNEVYGLPYVGMVNDDIKAAIKV